MLDKYLGNIGWGEKSGFHNRGSRAGINIPIIQGWKLSPVIQIKCQIPTHELTEVFPDEGEVNIAYHLSVVTGTIFFNDVVSWLHISLWDTNEKRWQFPLEVFKAMRMRSVGKFIIRSQSWFILPAPTS